MEDLEEFCNVERRLEGGDGLAPGSFWKMKMDLLIFCFCLDFLDFLLDLGGSAVKLGLPGGTGDALFKDRDYIFAGCRDTNISNQLTQYVRHEILESPIGLVISE